MISKIKKGLRATLGSSYDKIMVPRHYMESVLANVRYGFPSRNMRVIGVTGTNGKTTTANMIASIFTASGAKVGLISTANLQFGGELQPNDTHLTSANGLKLQRLIKKMLLSGCDTLVLEASSHALAQGRVWGIPIDVAVLTNISKDHLDYHKTMDNYVAAKARLFRKARKLSVLNIDDKYYEAFKKASRSHQIKTYGKNRHADTHLVNAKFTPKGANFKVSTGQAESNFHINQTGMFNVENAMAAITVARHYSLDDDIIQRGLLALKSVPGRTEVIDEGQDFGVIVDHAHTEDALRKLFTEIKSICEERLLILVSGDGDRDHARRRPIGRLAAELGDYLVLTEMENQTESSENIRSMIRDGIMDVPKDQRAKWVEVVDRSEGIYKLLSEAKKGDMVIIWGMGNQPYRMMNDGEHPWDEREVVREQLRKILAKKK